MLWHEYSYLLNLHSCRKAIPSATELEGGAHWQVFRSCEHDLCEWISAVTRGGRRELALSCSFCTSAFSNGMRLRKDLARHHSLDGELACLQTQENRFLWLKKPPSVFLIPLLPATWVTTPPLFCAPVTYSELLCCLILSGCGSYSFSPPNYVFTVWDLPVSDQFHDTYWCQLQT